MIQIKGIFKILLINIITIHGALKAQEVSKETIVLEGPVGVRSWHQANFPWDKAIVKKNQIVKRIGIVSGTCSQSKQGLKLQSSIGELQLIIQLAAGNPLGPIIPAQVFNGNEEVELLAQFYKNYPTKNFQFPNNITWCPQKNEKRRFFHNIEYLEYEQLKQDVTQLLEQNKSDFHLMLDSGHGKNALSQRKVGEYKFNNKVVNEIIKELNSIPRIKISLTKKGLQDTPLSQRVKTISEAVPNLMVSVHHDNISRRLKKNGYCPQNKGFTIYINTYNRWRKNSYFLAKMVSENKLAMNKTIGRFFYYGETYSGINNGDLLYLLKNINVPAILIENDFMCNKEFQKEFRTFYKNDAQLISKSILQYILKINNKFRGKISHQELHYGEFEEPLH